MRALVFVILLLAGCSKPPVPVSKPTGPQRLLIPSEGKAYTGAYIDFGEREDSVSLDLIEQFEAMVGKHQAIICSSSFWGEENFPAENIGLIWRHGSIPMILWSPWARPYFEEVGPDRYNLDAILSGQWDQYIDSWADGARAFGQPLMVSLMNEMNGTWFPWSGFFYIKKDDALIGPPNPRMAAEKWKAAYRHVVDRVRARGANNIQWIFHANNFTVPSEEWNRMRNYYPGAEYVDWLGLSVYGQQVVEAGWISFSAVMDKQFAELCQVDPSKPVMLVEWGVGEYPQCGSKADWLRDAFQSMEQKCPRLKAAVFWHERWRNADLSFSNLRVNSSPSSLEAYRSSVLKERWLGYPLLESVK